jgi:hypothetical protein
MFEAAMVDQREYMKFLLNKIETSRNPKVKLELERRYREIEEVYLKTSEADNWWMSLRSQIL